MTPLLQDLVNHRCYCLVCDRHRARSLSRAVPPEPLEYTRDSLDVGAIANHGLDAFSLDPRSPPCRRHDSVGMPLTTDS